MKEVMWQNSSSDPASCLGAAGPIVHLHKAGWAARCERKIPKSGICSSWVKDCKTTRTGKGTQYMAGKQEISRKSQMFQIPYSSVNNIINRKRGRLIRIKTWKGGNTKYREKKIYIYQNQDQVVVKGTLFDSKSYSNAIRYGEYLHVAVGINPCIIMSEEIFFSSLHQFCTEVHDICLVHG